MGLTVLSGSIVIAMALMTDHKQTIVLVTAIITIRGVTFLAKKITATINKDCSDLIDFTGWCISGVSIISLLKISLSGLEEISASIEKITGGFHAIGNFFDKVASVVDKVTFWN